VEQFSYGLLSPLMSYAVSCVGAALGLLCMSKARGSEGGARVRWLLFAALSIGGTGIWAMHFIAMLGFGVVGTEITYDIPMTAASMVVAVTIVGVGLGIVVAGGGRIPPLLLGGVITGLGVASMHYLGMAAMHMPGGVTYKPNLFGASLVIAVVAATAALWAALNIRGTIATTGAALVMGVAVVGMHYTGMEAVKINLAAAQMYRMPTSPGGMTAAQLLAPLIIGVTASSLIVMFLVILAPSEAEMRTEAEMNRNLEAIRSRR
jgi:NO-binding membrane sensor protein with MHYT domain